MENNLSGNKQWRFENPTQIISMGGPWIGNLYIGEKLVSGSIILDNVIFNEFKKQLLFIRFYKLSRWRSKNYFKINYYDLIDKQLYEFEKKFDMVFIKKFLDQNNLEIYKAFHDKLIETKEVFNIQDETFSNISSV